MFVVASVEPSGDGFSQVVPYLDPVRPAEGTQDSRSGVATTDGVPREREAIEGPNARAAGRRRPSRDLVGAAPPTQVEDDVVGGLVDDSEIAQQDHEVRLPSELHWLRDDEVVGPRPHRADCGIVALVRRPEALVGADRRQVVVVPLPCEIAGVRPVAPADPAVVLETRYAFERERVRGVMNESP